MKDLVIGLSAGLAVLAIVWVPVSIVRTSAQEETIRELETELAITKQAYASTGEDLRICNAILHLTLESK